MDILLSGLIFLAATVIAVPIFKKLKLGAILGYLTAGVIIGPQVLALVDHPHTLLHYAELGVVLLLFLIGLELEPQKLWKMRNDILVTGGSQLLISAIAVGLVLHFLADFSWLVSAIIGLSLALSSTAFAVQLLTEHNILKSPPGQKAFSMLLMQDLAVIPILLLVSSFSTIANASSPPWWITVAAIIAVLVIGRYLVNPFLHVISKHGSQEVMTAAALLIVIATAMGMQQTGLSMGMGAFVAGMLLANSSFRHQLETEIAPFKGLLLGLFFIAIGMNLDLSLLATKPVSIISSSIVLIAIKAAIIFTILRLGKQSTIDSMRVGLMLSQGGEFAFVVLAQAAEGHILTTQTANEATLIVGLSMALTAPLVILHSLFYSSKNCPPVYDSQSETHEPEILIAGFGRFGQITGRILSANGIAFTALDKDATHIAFAKKFGNKIFFGDASRLDLLVSAGISHAKIILIAVDSEQDTMKIATLVSHHYPNIKIIARARNRASVKALTAIGVETSVRELFAGSLEAANLVLQSYGISDDKAAKTISLFSQHDEKLLKKSATSVMNDAQLIAASNEGRKELAELFSQDINKIN